MIVFSNAANKKEKRDWTWQKEKIEEMEEFKYLGYTFQRNNEEALKT